MVNSNTHCHFHFDIYREKISDISPIKATILSIINCGKVLGCRDAFVQLPGLRVVWMCGETGRE